jgi:DNA mismatch repair protein MutS
LAANADTVSDLHQLLAAALTDSPPLSLRDGNILRSGYNAELDQLRKAKTEGKDWIASLESKERERTGIKSLRVGFNQVFGYYLEISRPNLPAVPPDYIRKQTLTNGERFITPELKEYEALVLGAEEKIAALEFELFTQLRAKVAAEAQRLQTLARLIAAVDLLAALAEVACRQNYVCQQVESGNGVEIEAGRHPVVEASQEEQSMVSAVEPFIPNDCRLDSSDQQLIILTGPNMAGKSTYLRQVALIVLLAQMGSFVPAKSARIGLVDRIFTRVGAADDLASGRSTFMMEMTEAANILHNATAKSLIILDEIGRGTSTFDGLSIAWAVAEYIHNSIPGAKTLFATHYHQLNELAETLPRIKNYRVAVKEKGDTVIFLRKVVPGGTDRSYGIHVARLAGLPQPVLERAKQVLWSLEQSNHLGQPNKFVTPPPIVPPPTFQMTLFEPAENPLLSELAALDIDSLTPRDALNKLAEIQAKLKSQVKKPK